MHIHEIHSPMGTYLRFIWWSRQWSRTDALCLCLGWFGCDCRILMNKYSKNIFPDIFGKTLWAIIQRWICVFLPVAFLRHDFTLSSLCGWFPGRRLTLPCVPPPPPPRLFCHFGGSKEKVAVKATPLPSLQPPRSIFKMRSDDTRAPGALLHIHADDGGVLWRKKRALTLWCKKKGRDSKSHVRAVCV